MRTMENENLRVQISDHGAELSSIYDKAADREAVWIGDPAFWNRHAPVLFPFVGKVNGGFYTHKGVKYPMGQHGFARDNEFECIENTENKTVHRLVSTEETKKVYPFDFAFTVTQELSGRTLTITWKVENTGDDDMYFSVGGHPAFMIPEQYDIVFNKGLENHTEAINAQLIALSRSAAPGCLIAGDIATLAAFCDSWDTDNFDLLVENYRRQIRGLIDGGADLLVGETLLYPQEAEAILTAAELEGAGATMITYSMQSGGFLYSGHDAGPLMGQLENWGAAAVGFNCVAADMMTPHLVSKLRRSVKVPLICKPNAGIPIINEKGQAEYKLEPEPFARIVKACYENGASFLGGCCGTTPAHMAALKKSLDR